MPEDEGWTFVRPRGRGKRPLNAVPAPHKPLQPATTYRPAAAIRAEYEKHHSSFLQSACWKQLQSLVASHCQNFRSNPIDQAICLGVGTFDPSDGAWEAKRRAYIQTIAFTLMVREIEKITESTVKCIFQEPLFTPSDKEFLTSLGHVVVDSPQGCDMVTSSSLLYAIHLYNPVYSLALQNQLPAVMICTDWDVLDRMTSFQSDVEKKQIAPLKELDKTYQKLSFPQEESITTFSNTVLYLRPD